MNTDFIDTNKKWLDNIFKILNTKFIYLIDNKIVIDFDFCKFTSNRSQLFNSKIYYNYIVNKMFNCGFNKIHSDSKLIIFDLFDEIKYIFKIFNVTPFVYMELTKYIILNFKDLTTKYEYDMKVNIDNSVNLINFNELDKTDSCRENKFIDTIFDSLIMPNKYIYTDGYMIYVNFNDIINLDKFIYGKTRKFSELSFYIYYKNFSRKMRLLNIVISNDRYFKKNKIAQFYLNYYIRENSNISKDNPFILENIEETKNILLLNRRK